MLVQYKETHKFGKRPPKYNGPITPMHFLGEIPFFLSAPVHRYAYSVSLAESRDVFRFKDLKGLEVKTY